MRALFSAGLLFVLASTFSASLFAQAPAQPAALSGSCPLGSAQGTLTEGQRDLLAGDFAAAERFFLAHPESSTASSGVVEAELGEDKPAEALSTARRAAGAPPQSPEALTALGDALLQNALMTEAAQAFGKAMRMDKCNARAHAGAAAYYVRVGLNDRAEKELALAHRLAPGDPGVILAWALSLPPATRPGAIKAYLLALPAAATPAETARRARLSAEAALAEAGKTCMPVESNTAATLTLAPTFVDGRIVRDWGLQVGFNGKSSDLLELDSSVDGIVLGRHYAAKIGIQTLPESANGFLGYAGTIQIGKLTWKDCPVHIVDDTALANARSVISTSFFADHLIHIDWTTQTLALRPYPDPAAPAPEQKAWARVFLVNNRIVMPTMVDKKGKLFVLDTGNPWTIMAPNPADPYKVKNVTDENLQGHSGEFVRMYHVDNRGDVGAHVTGVDGKEVLVNDLVGLPMLRFGGTESLVHTTYSFDLSGVDHALGMHVDGLLGFLAIRNNFIDIDYRHAQVNFVNDVMNRYDERRSRNAY